MNAKHRTKFEIRNSKHGFRGRFWVLRISNFDLRVSPILLLVALFLAVPATAQAQEPETELVANLAAGRVVVCVAKDGILIATVENKIEADSKAPVVVPLSGKRVAILLGAVEWVVPASADDPVRLEKDLRGLMGEIAGPRRLQQEQGNDIEMLGTAFLEPLRKIAGRLHRLIEIGEDEPLIEMLLVGYVENYGPEVWSLRYRMAQDPLRGDYWQTRILRPAYEQLYPPEKEQPRTLMEARYPPQDESPDLLALLTGEPLAKVRAASEPNTRASQRILKGESNKATIDDTLALMRAALDAVIPPEKQLSIAVIRERTGFEWILAPPAPPKSEEEKRPAGAPTLRKPPQ